MIPIHPGEAAAAGSTYAELSRRIASAGLMARRPGYYTAKVTATVAALLAGWAAFLLLGNTWWQMLVAAFLGLAFTQVAFVGHDAGHRQIFRTRRAAYVAGLLLGNLGIGLSYGWWVDKHNRHHAHPNDLDTDPDIKAGALVYTSGQARLRRGVSRWLSRIQAYLFFPMLLLEGLNLHLSSGRALTGRTVRSRRVRALEAALFLAHVAGYLTVVFLVLSPIHAIVFVVVHQAVFGLYMGMSFAPNHKGMPVPTGADQRDYLRRQVLTSRNIRGGRFVDFALGGLNYQIEHHLFPSMPRPNLHHARALVRSFCTEHDVSYTETGPVRSYAIVLKHLNTVGTSM
ncbi:fatty acid desaturase family protein [Actinocatenispora rupis]|uniref:Delta fatty acid desaturase n=1 Tax=Actinocatenispora rupis TaxID=519421 RepID=A0A8J3N8M1_9ACTN|nr:acyl-CoA desaturase [Actinocatenispora rupis]GID10236.1 delta fatty acid desaturase [Actinocatenispora rupis]